MTHRLKRGHIDIITLQMRISIHISNGVRYRGHLSSNEVSYLTSVEAMSDADNLVINDAMSFVFMKGELYL